jgi:hypothetical protein
MNFNKNDFRWKKNVCSFISYKIWIDYEKKIEHFYRKKVDNNEQHAFYIKLFRENFKEIFWRFFQIYISIDSAHSDESIDININENLMKIFKENSLSFFHME